jgi:orotidine-5'-phosphate decarboxylase
MPISELLNPSSAPASQLATNAISEARKRLIVALDVPDAAAAAALAARLEGTCQWFKVGLELFVAAGPAVLEPLLKRGHSIFLDLKFHDIPNTVSGAVRSAASLGVHMMTVHASGGPAMLSAARASLEGLNNPPELLAVTVLTSMDSAQSTAVGVERSTPAQVELLARMGLAAGIRGFVCSPQEVATVRGLTGPDGILVIPGIRPAGAGIGDQKRIATPAEALRAGRQLPGRRPPHYPGSRPRPGSRGDSQGNGRGALFLLIPRFRLPFRKPLVQQNHTQPVPRARVIVFVHGIHGSRESWRASERRLLAGFDSHGPALRLFRR